MKYVMRTVRNNDLKDEIRFSRDTILKDLHDSPEARDAWIRSNVQSIQHHDLTHRLLRQIVFGQVTAKEFP